MGATDHRALNVLLLVVVAAILLSAPASAAEAAEDPDKWTFSILPYLWFPTMEADLKFSAPKGSTGEPEVSVDPDDYFENLDLAIIVTTGARKGKWSIAADFIFMELSSSDSSVETINFGNVPVSATLDIGTDVDMQSFITTFGGDYRIIDHPRLKMELMAGVRYLWMEADLDWRLSGEVTGPQAGATFARSGSHSQDGDIWNGVGGIRGQILLGDGNWFIPFYADIGTGDSDLTWQVYGALGYSFKTWFEAMLGYRHMEFDSDDDERIQELRLSGPVIGARFNF